MPDNDLPGMWISISDLARRDGISRSSAKERVDRLVAKGLIETRRSGRSVVFNLAAYVHAAGQVGDPAKELAAAETRQPSPASGAFRDAQTRKAEFEAQLKELDYLERIGKLLPIEGPHGVREAAARIGQAAATQIDAIVRHADELATAVSREGVAGARRVLKDIGRQLRLDFSDALKEIAMEGRRAEQAGLPPLTNSTSPSLAAASDNAES